MLYYVLFKKDGKSWLVENFDYSKIRILSDISTVKIFKLNTI